MRSFEIAYFILLIALTTLAVGCGENAFSTVGIDPQSKTLITDDSDQDIVYVEEDLPKKERDEIEKRYRCHMNDKNHHNNFNSQSAGQSKVQICHVPPGNPDARHTICIAVPALRAHVLENHNTVAPESNRDHYGPCLPADL